MAFAKFVKIIAKNSYNPQQDSDADIRQNYFEKMPLRDQCLKNL